MRIGLDLQSTRGELTGIGVYARELARALPAADPANEYVPLSYRGFRRWPAPAEIARMQFRLTADMWLKRLDVVHSPGFAPPIWGRSRRIMTLHDLSVLEHPDLLPSGPSRWYWGRWLAETARRCDCIVTPSRFTAAVAQARLHLPPERFRVVPYPPRPEFRPTTRATGLPQRFILGVGALEPRKDWLSVVRAFSLLADRCPHALVLAGPVNVAASDAALRAEISRLGLRDRVRCLGYVPEHMLPALYSAASVFVFPETYAGYGLPPLEAMACGTPVVCFDNTALTETAGGAAVLVPPPYHPEVIAQRMFEIVDNSDLRECLSRLGLAHAARLSWDDTARSMIRIYEELGPLTVPTSSLPARDRAA